MNNFDFNTHSSLKDKTYRFFKAAGAPFFKYLFLSGFIYFVKINLNTFFYNYFDLQLEKQKVVILQSYAKKAGENLSLLSPTKISDYITSLTASTFTSAKVASLEKTVNFLTSFFDTVLFLILIYFLYAFITKSLSNYKEKERDNEIANLVVKKLLPLLKEK